MPTILFMRRREYTGEFWNAQDDLTGPKEPINSQTVKHIS